MKKILITQKSQTKKPPKKAKGVSPRKTSKATSPNPIPMHVETGKEDLERAESRYKEKYGFKKPTPVRSPVEGFEHRIVKENMYEHYSPKEKSLVIGGAHGYGHKGGQIKGSVRTSGHPGAHQIGKKK